MLVVNLTHSYYHTMIVNLVLEEYTEPHFKYSFKSFPREWTYLYRHAQVCMCINPDK